VLHRLCRCVNAERFCAFGRRQRTAGDRIEPYLRKLRRWAPASYRDDLVAEARRHLYDATYRHQQRGMSRYEAQRAAVRAFGPAWRIGLAARQAEGSAWASWLLRLGRLHPRPVPRLPPLPGARGP